MKLQDLPTEIINMIIAHLINNERNPYAIDLVFVWRLRRLSKTFNEVIMREVLRNTPLRAFRSQASRKLLSNNMSRYLCAHVQRTRVGKKLEDRRDGQPIKAQYFLMDYITKILDRIYLLSDNETISNKTRERHEAILCDAVVDSFSRLRWPRGHHDQKWRDLEHLIIYKKDCHTNAALVSKLEGTIDLGTVAAAAAIGDKAALQVLLATRNMWKDSSAFGNPFCAAAFGGQISIVEDALTSLVSSCTTEYTWRPKGILIHGFEIAVEKGYGQIALLIFNFLRDHFTLTPYYIANLSNPVVSWLEKATSNGDEGLVRAILQFRNFLPHYESEYYKIAFTRACRKGQVDIACLYLEMKLFQNKDLFPLITAIFETPKKQRAQLVVKLLALGADLSGTGLAVAVVQQDMNVVNVLLNHNATLSSDKPATEG